MAILKLPNLNDTFTGHVTGCEEVAGQFGAQVKFLFSSLDILFLPAETAHRQLLHAGFADAGGNPPKAELSTVKGNTLSFSRTANKTPGAKPYWNIAIATGPAPTASKRLQGPSAVPGDAPKGWPDAPPPTDADAPFGVNQAPPDQYDGQASGEVPEPIDYPVRAATGQADGKDGHREALWEKIGSAYEWALNTAFALQCNMEGAASARIVPTMETIQAGAATLLIQAERMGAIR